MGFSLRLVVCCAGRVPLLPKTLLRPAALALLGSGPLGLGPLLPLRFWLQVSVVAHAAADVCFYDWPVQLFWPFSSRSWGLVGWNDLAPTLALSERATAVSSG